MSLTKCKCINCDCDNGTEHHICNSCALGNHKKTLHSGSKID